MTRRLRVDSAPQIDMEDSHMNRIISITALIASIFFTAIPAQAQCFGDDGFAVPGACCVPVTPNLPQFPALTIPAEGACFLDCSLEQNWNATIGLGAPIPIFCDLYAVPITIFSPQTPTATTFLIAKYVRTWLQVDPTGLGNVQVWRFLVNADINYLLSTTSVSPCPVPQTAMNGLKVHFIGSLEYALDCANSNQWQAAINLTHLCGAYMHHPLSQKPMTVNPNPDRIYCFVGPTPFDWNATPPPPQGTAQIGDAERSTAVNLGANPPLWQCQSESTIFNAALTPLAQGCPCSSGTTIGTPRFTDLDLRFDYGCTASTGATYAPIPFPPLAPSGLTSFTIGRYMLGPFNFPDDRGLHVLFGVAVAPDLCANGYPFHFIMGTAWTGGLGGLTFGGMAPGAFVSQLIDLANMESINFFGPGFPTFGGPFISTRVFSLGF